MVTARNRKTDLFELEGPLKRFIDQILGRSHAPLEFEGVLQKVLDEGHATSHERQMLKNVLRFHRTRVSDAMIPRPDIVSISVSATLEDVLRIYQTAGHSRLPAYGETLDDQRGMLHIRDFLDFITKQASNTKVQDDYDPENGPPPIDLSKLDLSITLIDAKLVRPILFVPSSMPTVELLLRMQATRTHMALVIDEFGGTEGLVTIEDLVELVVGDIEDEHDDPSRSFVAKEKDGIYLADARADLIVVSREIGYDIVTHEAAADVDTLGGFVTAIAERMPIRNEVITCPDGLEFEILDADPRRIKRIRIHMRNASSGSRSFSQSSSGDLSPQPNRE